MSVLTSDFENLTSDFENLTPDFEDFENDQPPPRYLLKILSNLIDEEGIIEFEKVDAELLRLAIETPNAHELIDMAESQGLLMRHPLGGWQWLG